MMHSILIKPQKQNPGPALLLRHGGCGSEEGKVMGELGSRVLLVEDELLISDMMASVLEQHGFQVHSVISATEALRYLTGGAPCDVLFTDINLPGDVDGTVLAKLARELRPGLAVVYASGKFAKLDDMQAVPGSTFVPKPYDPEKVCTLLEEVASHH